MMQPKDYSTAKEMKNSLTKEEIGNDLLVETLHALYASMSRMGHELIIVGASARDIVMKLLAAEKSRRKTFDLDVAIALKDWSQFANLCDTLTQNNFKKLKSKQKFVYKGPDNQNDYEVDVVPFGEIAEDEVVKWPPELSPEMSVRCYDDLMRFAIDIKLDGIPVKIIPLAGQFIIKLDTWIDRNDRENKDAIDLIFILSNYYYAAIMNAADIPDEVDYDDDAIVAGAQWIAIEGQRMLSSGHLQYYRDFLKAELEKKEESKFLQHLTIGEEDNPEFWHTVERALDEMASIWTNHLNILANEGGV